MEQVMWNVVRGVVMLMLGVGVAGCGSTYSWHQKMTVDVEMGGQVYSGSSVVGVTWSRHPDWLPAEGNYKTAMYGEAVVLQLPKNRYLFALLTDQIFLARKVFYDKLKGTFSGVRWLEILSNLRETRDISPKDYPLLVTFTDITDPKTVQKVNPENLEDTFGSGVSLKRITLEITDEPVTEGQVEKVLGWLNSVNRLVEPKPGALLKDTPVEHRLYHLDFRRK